jgi:hypothetical protein
MSAAEPSMPGNTIIEEPYQAGTGLPVGKIQTVRGEAIVFHRRPSAGYRAETGLPLYEGDTISTRRKGRILCRLIDGSRFTLAPNTTLSIHKCSYNSVRKTGNTFLFLKQGEVRFLVRKPAELSFLDYKVETPTAFATIDSAEFVTRSETDTTVITTFAESRLEVTQLSNPENVIFISALQRIVVPDELAPSSVDTISQEETYSLRAEFNLSPTSKLFASSPEQYETKDSGEDRRAGGNFVEGDLLQPVFDIP